MFPLVESSLGRIILSNKGFRLRSCVEYQSVRNHKKPIWVPIAKSKMYKNIVDIPPPKMEFEEMTALQESYTLYNRSLWKFQDGITRELEAQQQKEAIQVSEDVELERIFKMNDVENENVRKNREESLLKEWEEVEKEILQMRKQKEEEELQTLEKTEEFLESEMKRLEGAIKPEDVDELIEKALGAVWDYNFAIDKTGRISQGRHNSVAVADISIPAEPLVTPVEGTK
ncbi:putative 28S ribosomal protein S26, mitochondrial [Orchesella cincta]|uniref:Small ribosomal subunit protein mS26 n=1 Tax=Orchesella cincta TaxID=48709 RepID=A0A1D2NFS1_ORCCI|nr:putative 28S ribosomal protein S26, mitochondrial [Orchesella cincta]